MKDHLPWTPAEDKTLTLARAAGMTFEQCAEYLPGRSPKACASRTLKASVPAVDVFTIAEAEATDGSKRLLRRQLETRQHFITNPAQLAQAMRQAGVA